MKSTIVSLALLVNLVRILDAFETEKVLKCKQSSKKERKIYDFIVVGGGTAGCIVATRLSENNQFSVLLLEAGGEPPLISRIPMMAPTMQQTQVDWNYTTVVQKNSHLSDPGQRAYWPRGKMLGGSSSLNFINFFRANKRDFEHWENGWKWNDVLPYYLKVENSRLENINEDVNKYGKSGNIPLTTAGGNHPLLVSFMNALNQMGYRRRDPNDGIQTGYDLTTMNQYHLERRSPFTNYLKPVMNCRRNLKVKTFAMVEKIIFKNKKAIGVVYSKNNCKQKVMARNEVILAAGAINTPQLLMLSGVGPKDHLKSLKIKVINDLPVGNNLQDHLFVAFWFSAKFKPIFTKEAVDEFFSKRTGPLTEYGCSNAFVNTKYSKDSKFPDIQIITPSWTFPGVSTTELNFGVNPLITRPESRGFIRLRSNYPYDQPLIDPKYFSVHQDVKVLAEGSKFIYNLTKLMEKNDPDLDYKRVEVTLDACDQYPKSGDKFWFCFVKHTARTVFHPCGTCKMGSKSDSSSVVDGELKVIGMNGIRVVDASVMPSIVTPNLQATVMMIAEKASDLIKHQFSNSCKKTNFKQLLFKVNSCSICE